MLTASIVLFNTQGNQIDLILESVANSTTVERLFIIDNSLNDKWRILERRFADKINIRYIHNANIGYGASHNLAMQEAIEMGSTYHVVLNPDISFAPEVLPALCSFMDSNPDTVYVLPKVVYPNGELQYLCKLLPTPNDLIFRRFFSGTKFAQKADDRYCLKSSGYDKVMNPPCLSGCFMFMRLETLQKHNLFFDSRFFMYFEDFDLIRRLHCVGKTLYYPKLQIIHDHQKESYKSRKMLMIHIKSAFRYFNKWGWFFDRERREMNKKILAEISSDSKTSTI